MSKHTPGPWLRDRHSGLNCDVRAANGRKVALCWGLSQTAIRNSDAYRAECDANAVLIAAAPALLEACEHAAEMLEAAGWKDGEGTVRYMLGAAIRAAREG